MDNIKNFAKGTLAAGIDSSATSANLTAGHGARFPAAPFKLTIWNSSDYANPADAYAAGEAEIVRVTNLSTDALTIVRGQDGTSAVNLNTAGKTYSVIQALTAEDILSLYTDAALTGATTAEQISPVPAPMGALAIDVTKARNTKSVTADSTFTFSATPPAGAVFGLRLTGDGTPRAITIPSSYSTSQNATITGFTLPANGTVYLCWEYTGSGYNLTGEPLPPPRVQTNAQVASYELVLSDEGKVVEITSGSANDLSVPNNSDVPYPIGAQIIPRQGGTGQTTIVPLSGVTINSRDGALKLAGQYASAVLTKKATNTWNLDGDIVT